MDENRDQNVPTPNGPPPGAAPPPYTPYPAYPPEWYARKSFLHAHKRVLMGMLAGFLIGMFFGGTMAMSAVRHMVTQARIYKYSAPAPRHWVEPGSDYDMRSQFGWDEYGNGKFYRNR